MNKKVYKKNNTDDILEGDKAIEHNLDEE